MRYRTAGAGLDFTGARSWIEAANPFPLVSVMRVADALGDGTGLNVAIVNVPAILAVGGSAAGEGGHATIEARDMAQGKPTYRLRATT
jgi:hypothetical protein